MKVLILLVLAGSTLWGGGQMLYTWFTNQEPLQMSCAEYAEQRPDAEWLKLSGCNFKDSFGYEEGDKPPYDKIYVPLVAANADPDTPATVVMEIEDGKAIKQFQEADYTLLQNREISGLVEFGIELDDDTYGQLKNILNVKGDYVMVKHQAKPELGFAIFMTVLGLAFLGGLVWSVSGGKDDEGGEQKA